MIDADAAGLQLSIHAIGDEANRLLLDYLERLHARNGARDRRFRLVHAQVVAPEDFARFGALGVVAEVQPFHLSDDMRWMEERIGTERSRGAYAFRSLLDGGATLSFGSDWPGTAASEYPIDPLLGLYAATSRTTVAGEPAGGWFPDQRLTIEEALRAYTWGSSYANFADDRLGTLETGKLADLAVIDRNLLDATPAELLSARVLVTVVGGRIVYEAPD
jgi:predicted amidohydrolase YtcJ